MERFRGLVTQPSQITKPDSDSYVIFGRRFARFATVFWDEDNPHFSTQSSQQAGIRILTKSDRLASIDASPASPLPWPRLPTAQEQGTVLQMRMCVLKKIGR